jgi:hypothetical protein
MRFALLLWLAFPLYAETPSIIESPMTRDQLEAFFDQQKRGAPVELTLAKGKVVKGLYRSYDDYYETVWIVPQGEPGVFSQKGYKIAGIRKAVPWERKPVATGAAAPVREEMGSDEYYLLNENPKK